MIEIVAISALSLVTLFNLAKSYSFKSCAKGKYKKVSVYQYTAGEDTYYVPVVHGAFGFKFGMDLDLNVSYVLANSSMFTNIDRCFDHLEDFLQKSIGKTDMKLKHEIKYKL